MAEATVSDSAATPDLAVKAGANPQRMNAMTTQNLNDVTDHVGTHAEANQRHAWKWTPLVTVCLGAFMLLVDVSIVNVALPKMTEELHSSFTSLQWVVDMYALVLASLLMVAGSLGDRFGHRRLYIGGLVVFALVTIGIAKTRQFLVLHTATQDAIAEVLILRHQSAVLQQLQRHLQPALGNVSQFLAQHR